MKKIVKSVALVAVLLLVMGQTSLLAFTSQGRLNSNTFSTGRADLLLLSNPALPADSSNLVSELPGYTFDNVTSFWQRRIGVKVKNTGTLLLNAQLKVAARSTISSPDLMEKIKVSVFRWQDNNDGVVQPLELVALTSEQTMKQWLNQPFTLGNLPSQALGSYVLDFSIGELPNTYQGVSTTVDFIFDALAVN